MIKSITLWISRYIRSITVILILLTMGMLIFTIKNIRLEHDITKLIPTGHQQITEKFKLIKNIGVLEQFLFDISLSGKKSNDTKLMQIADTFVQKLKKTSFFKQITYKLSPTHSQKIITNLYKKQFALTIPPEHSLQNITDDDFIRKRLDDLKFKLLSPESIFTKEYLINDPLALAEQSINYIMSQNVSYSVKIKNNTLFSEDGKHILIIAQPAMNSFEIDKIEVMINQIRRIIATIQSTSNQNIRIAMLGGHIYALTAANMIKSDITLIFILSTIGVAFIYLLSFRRLKILFISMIPVLFGLISALFFVTAILKHIHGVTIVFGSTLIGICIDYSTHYFTSYTFISQTNEHDTPALVIKSIGKSLFFGYLTTLLSFLVFLFSGLRFLQEIALFSSVGITSAFLISLFIIPQFRIEKEIRIGLLLTWSHSILVKTENFLGKHKLITIIVTTAIFVISIFLTFQVDFDNDITHLNYVESGLKKLEREFISRYGDISTSNMIIVTGDSVENVLLKNDHVYQLLVAAKKKKQIANFFNIHPFLPSIKKQKENLQKIKTIDWSLISKKVNQYSEKLGFKIGAFKAYFDGIKQLDINRFSFITMQDIENSPFAALLNKVMNNQQGQITLLSYFRPGLNKDYTNLIDQIKQIDKKVYYINQVNLINEVIQLLKSELIKIVIISFVIISVTLLIVYKSIVLSLLALLPSLFGIFVSLAIHYLIGAEINIMTLFALILIVGIGLDYGIFMLESQHNHKMQEYTPLAIIIAGITTILAFGILIISANKGLASIGMIIFLGIALTMTFSILIIPLLKSYTRKEVQSKMNIKQEY